MTPHNVTSSAPLEAESAVLCAAMSDSLAGAGTPFSDLVCQGLTADDFEDKAHRIVFVAVQNSKRKGLPIDRRTVQAELISNGTWFQVGIAKLAEIAYDLPDFDHLPAYIKVLKTSSAQRGVLNLLPEIDRRVRSGEALSAVVGNIGERFTALATDSAESDLYDLRDSFGGLLNRLEHPVPSRFVGLSTGFPALDDMVKGFQPGQVIVLAGHTGKGKTTLGGCLTLTAIQAKVPTAYYSLEMSRQSIAMRFVSNLARVPLGGLLTGHLSTKQKDEIREAHEYLSRLPLVLQDTSSGAITMASLSASLRKARVEHCIGFAVVDYLGLLAREPGAKHENRNIEVSEMSRAMKLLAGELDIPILVLHQLNRASAARGESKPILSDLRDSGSIEQDADTVLFIHHAGSPHRAAGEASPTEAEIIVAKNRNGPTGLLQVRAELEHFRFRPL